MLGPGLADYWPPTDAGRPRRHRGGSRSVRFHTGNKPLVKDKKKPKKKPQPPKQPSKEASKENNGAKDAAAASKTKKGKKGAK